MQYKEPFYSKNPGGLFSWKNIFELTFQNEWFTLLTMVKILNHTKITLDDGRDLYTGVTGHVSISSDRRTEGYEIGLGRVYNLEKHDSLSSRTSPGRRGETPITKPSVPSTHYTALLEAARKHEKTMLDGAHKVADAKRQADSANQAAAHELNLALLAYYHAGNTAEQAEALLNENRLFEYRGRADTVARLGTEELYGEEYR